MNVVLQRDNWIWLGLRAPLFSLVGFFGVYLSQYLIPYIVTYISRNDIHFGFEFTSIIIHDIALRIHIG